MLMCTAGFVHICQGAQFGIPQSPPSAAPAPFGKGAFFPFPKVYADLGRFDTKSRTEYTVRLLYTGTYLSRPNFLLKRLTRPPVSTIFCLPV